MADQSRGALDRYWDDLVRDRPSTRDALDPSLADAVRSFHAAQDVDGPTPAFVARLQGDLMSTTTAPLPLPRPIKRTVVPNGAMPRARTTRTPGIPDLRRSRPAPAAVAALILVAMGLGYLAQAWDHGNPSRLGGIPAPVVDDGAPLPDGVTDAETLVEVVMPTGIIPPGTRTDLALMFDSIPSGTVRKAGLDQTGCCAGLNVNLILTGTATVRAEGPMQLIPKGGNLEPVMITPGSDVVVGPGDALVYRQETTWEWIVSESGPMSILWGVAYGGIFSPYVNMGFGHPEDFDALPNAPVPADGYPIRVWRATLEPGATLLPEPGASLLMVADPATDARIGELLGDAQKNLGPEPVSVYLMSVGSTPPDGAAEGQDQPAVSDEGVALGPPVELIMPGDIIAAGERTDLALMLYTVPSGTTTRPAGTDFNGCCPGLDVAFVLAGTATVRGDGPMQLIPGEGGIEPRVITAGTDVVIKPGDTLLFEEDVATDWTVVDGGSMSLLWGLVLGGAILDPPFGPSTWVAEDIQMTGPVTFPSDPFAIRLWPTILAPGATLDPDPGDVQLAAAYPSENARIAEPGGYAYKNVGNEPLDLYVMTLSTTDPGPASPIAAAPSPTSTR